MSRNTEFLSQAVCTVILDGIIVEGFAPGDSIKLTPNAEGSAIDVGLDVAVTTFSTDRTGELELDLMPTSPFLDYVGALWTAQKTSAARLISGQILTAAAEPYRLEGVSVSDPGAVATGGKSAAPRSVKFKVQRLDLPQ